MTPFIVVARLRECRIKCSKWKCCAKCCPKDPPRCERAALRVLHMEDDNTLDHSDVAARERVDVAGAIVANPMVEMSIIQTRRKPGARLATNPKIVDVDVVKRPTEIDIDVGQDSDHSEASAAAGAAPSDAASVTAAQQLGSSHGTAGNQRSLEHLARPEAEEPPPSTVAAQLLQSPAGGGAPPKARRLSTHRREKRMQARAAKREVQAQSESNVFVATRKLREREI